jgi:hypothetical protein
LENERRNQIRHTFEPQPEETLSLTVDGHPVAILEMQDISPSGIGLLIDGRVTNDLEVCLHYIHGTSDIEVCGTVVWNSIADSKSNESSVGISFSEQDMPLVRYFQRHLVKPNVEFIEDDPNGS